MNVRSWRGRVVIGAISIGLILVIAGTIVLWTEKPPTVTPFDAQPLASNLFLIGGTIAAVPLAFWFARRLRVAWRFWKLRRLGRGDWIILLGAVVGTLLMAGAGAFVVLTDTAVASERRTAMRIFAAGAAIAILPPIVAFIAGAVKAVTSSPARRKHPDDG